MRGKIEAVIYAAEEPVTLAQLLDLFGAEALGERVPSSEPLPSEEGGEPDDMLAKRAARVRERQERAAVEAVVAELRAEYDRSDRGVEIREIAGGYRVGTKPEYHDAVRGFAKSLKPPMKLSLPALETLAVIAYKQPVTAPEVSEIRGVDSGGVLGSLLGRKLVTTAGRKQVVGRPILYKTTKEFLLRFGLNDLKELPSMEEFERMAEELEDSETAPLPVAGVSVSEDGTGDADQPANAGGEVNREGEKPRLAPLAIEMSEEEPEAAGISVNKSGMPVREGG